MDLGIEGLEWKRVIGHGGFGTVHLAHDVDHGRDVAVKVLTPLADDDERRRFDRERRLMGKLSDHPNIVTIHTSGISGTESPYLVMEHVTGGSLMDRYTESPLPWREVVDIGRSLADALTEAHAIGILHRDIKPQNVLVGRDGRAMLTDFGIAVASTDISMRDTISATPAFAPPELLNGRPADERGDVYSLAATLHACLTGDGPYSTKGQPVLTVLSRIANDPVPTVERPDVPPELTDLLRRALDKDPAVRPATMTAFAAELDAVADAPDPNMTAAVALAPPPPTTDEPDAPPDAGPNVPGGTGRRRRRVIALAATVAVVVVVGIAVTRDPDDGTIVDFDPINATSSTIESASGPSTTATTTTSPETTTSTSTSSTTTTTTTEITVGAAAPNTPGAAPSPRNPSPQPTSPPATSPPPTSPPATSPPPTSPPSTSPPPTSPPPTEPPVQTVTVPNVGGLGVGDARAQLSAAGLVVDSAPACSNGVAQTTSPGPGTVVEQGSIVSLAIAPCIVPNYVGLRLDDAIAVSRSIDGLTISWPDFCDDVVLGQSIAAGSGVARGTNIALTLTPCG